MDEEKYGRRRSELGKNAEVLSLYQGYETQFYKQSVLTLETLDLIKGRGLL